MLDEALLAELFGASYSRQKQEQLPIKEEADSNELHENTYFFPYRVEDLKAKFSAYMTQLSLAGLSYSVNKELPPRVELSGGNSEEVRESFMNRLHNEPETEAMLILKTAKTDEDLHEFIIERSGIRKYDAGLSGNAFFAVLGDVAHIEEKKRQVKSLKWEHELELLGL